MQGYKIITKGKYIQPQPSLPVSVSNYVMMEEGGKRYLMLKLRNERKESVSGLKLSLVQLDGFNAPISEQDLAYADVKGGAQFVIDEKIALSAACEDFIVRVVSVDYDKYRYTERDGKVCVDYLREDEEVLAKAQAQKDQLNGRKTAIATKTLKAPIFVCVFAVILLVVLSLVSISQLTNFKNTATSFQYENIKYAFANGVNTEDGDVIVTGYKGNPDKLIIPNRLEEHDVIAVEADAFAGKTRLKSVQFEGKVTVGARAFKDCKNLTSVNFENVTEVGDYAFATTGIAELVSSNLTSVGASAFNGCKSLTKTELSASKITLSDKVFQQCTSLETVRITAPTVYKGLRLFDGCSALTALYVKNLNVSLSGEINYRTYTFSEAFGSLANISTVEIETLGSMPNSFMAGVNVQSLAVTNFGQTAVSDSAFKDCHKLSSVSLPNIVKIGEYAFAGTALTEYDFSPLESIGSYAFSDSALIKADFGADQICTLGSGIFKGSKNLQSVTISAKRTQLPEKTFYGCESLETVKFGENSQLTNIGAEAFRECKALRKMTLADTVGQIGQKAFYDCNKLEEIVLPAALTQLRDETFSGCGALVRLQFNKNLQIIGKGAFQNCTALTDVVFTQEVDKIGESAFEGCGNLSRITFNSSLGSIERKAFKDCAVLSVVALPKALQYIGAGAFNGCNALTEITLPFIGSGLGNEKRFAYIFNNSAEAHLLPASLVKINLIGDVDIPVEAFKDCTSIQTVVLLGKTSNVGARSFMNCIALKEVVFSDALTTIGVEAFCGCTQLNSVTIKNGLLGISNGAFRSCQALTSISLPNSVQWIEKSAFEDCGALTEISLPFVGNGMGDTSFSSIFGYYVPSSLLKVTLTGNQNVPQSAFAQCANLKTVVMTGGMKAICANAFENCTNLQSITFPEGLTSIEPNAFYGCTDLTSVTFPESLSSIDEYAFYNAQSLTKLYVPDSVTRIGREAFGGCYNLKEISLPFTGNGQDNHELYYPFGYDGYNLPQSLTKVTLRGDDDVAEYAFNNCYTLQEIVLDGEVQSIGMHAFSGCTSLKKMTMPDTVKTISEYAFLDCSGITELHLSAELTAIERYAFQNCNQLRRVNLPAGLTSIGDGAFSFCYRLQSVSLPTLQSCGWAIFEYCYNLYEIQNLSGVELLYEPFYSYAGSEFFNHYTDIGEPMPKVEVNGYTFSLANADTANEQWYLTAYPAEAKDLSLPTGFNYKGEWIQNYKIPENLFRADSVVESVYLPAAVQTLGTRAMQGCYNLQRVNAENAAVTEIPNGCFSECYRLAEISLPQGLTTIKDYAFYYCQELRKILLPSTLTNIESASYGNGYAFDYCRKLYMVVNESALNIQKGSDEYGGVARYACVVDSDASAFSEFTVGDFKFMRYKDTYYLTDYIGEESATELFIGSFYHEGKALTDVRIAPYAFEYNWALRKLTLGSGVTEVCREAFYHTQLQSVDMSNSNVHTIGEKAFEGSSNQQECYLTELLLPTSLRTIEKNAFAYNKLQKVIFPKSLEKIGENAFYENSKLQEISFAENLREIGAYAFYNCDLRKVVFPESVECIGEGAFKYNNQLEEVTLSYWLSEIGAYAFEYCNLQKLTLPYEIQTIGDYAFASNWNLRETVIYCAPQTVGANAFYNCTYLYEVYNYSGVTLTMGGDSFGKIAKYALAVYEETGEGKRVVEQDGALFVRNKETGVWRLHMLTADYSQRSLPTSFVCENQTFTQYGLGASIFSQISPYSYIIVPKNVTFVESGAFTGYYQFNVYYEGSIADWEKIGGNNVYGNVYEYVSCVHANGQWTYDSYGRPSTSWSEYEAYVSSTCVKEGVREYYCTKCDAFKWSTSLPLAEHTFDDSGRCTVCGLEGETVDLESFATDARFVCEEGAFVYDENGLRMTNTDVNTSSILQFAADAKMTVYVSIDFGSGVQTGYFFVGNDEEVLVVDGSQSDIKFTLEKGGLLSFYYFNSGESNSETACGKITRILVVYDGVEQA